MVKKLVTELAYPDVVEITSQEQMDKITKYIKNIHNFDNHYKAYLLGKSGNSKGNGVSCKLEGYNCDYNKYKFEEIIFPNKIHELW
jgi:hypothetical protein